MTRDRDVAVVGAGLAGLRAARDLAGRGRSVVLLEARERVGGRGWTVELGGRRVELGGSWAAPGQREVRAEHERYGLPLRDYAPVRHARWLTGGALRRGLPVPWAELGALERALARILADAAAYAAGDARLGEPSAAAYVERLTPAPAVRDLLLAWWQVLGGSPPEQGAVGDALASVAGHGGLAGVLTSLAHGPVRGWSALAEALAAAPGVELRLGAAVCALDADRRGVSLTLASGEELRARAAVLAVPLNCLGTIAFAPPLPAAVAAAAGRNAGAAVKLVLLVRGLAPHGLAAGRAPGVPLHWWYADEEHDGAVLVTAFGPRDASFDPGERASVEAALAAFFPEAGLVDWAHHDWNADPWSRGTWLTAPAGEAGVLSAERFAPAGRIAFAGADVAREEAGWFEGALRSGAEAARQVEALLADESARAPR